MERTGLLSRMIPITMILLMFLIPFASAAMMSSTERVNFALWFNANQDSNAASGSLEYDMRDAMKTAVDKNYETYLVVVDSASSMNVISGYVATMKLSVPSLSKATMSFTNALPNIPPSSGTPQWLFYIEESTFKTIVSGNGGTVASYLSKTPAAGMIWLDESSSGSSNPFQNSNKEATYDIYENQVDGDKSQADCKSPWDWDPTMKCCGDDLADHGSWAMNSNDQSGYYTPFSYQASGQMARTNNLISTSPLAFQSICNLDEENDAGTGWLDAKDYGGEIINILGVEMLSDGSNWYVRPNKCTVKKYSSSTKSYSYLYFGDGADRFSSMNRWAECGPGPNNDGSLGGLNYDDGEFTNCDGDMYFCAKVEGKDEYEWISENTLRTNSKYYTTCNQLGVNKLSGASGSGGSTFKWTGSNCCFGDMTYNDKYSVPINSNKEHYADGGACFDGIAYPVDKNAVFDMQVSDWLVVRGQVQGCSGAGYLKDTSVNLGLTSTVIKNAPPKKSYSFGIPIISGTGIRDDYGADLVTPNSMCTVVTESVYDAPASSDLDNQYYCSFDGRWLEYNDDYSLSKSYAPSSANLAPNPTFELK